MRHSRSRVSMIAPFPANLRRRLPAEAGSIGFQSSDQLIDPRSLTGRQRRRGGRLGGASVVGIVVIAGVGRVGLWRIVSRLHGGRRCDTRNTHRQNP